MADLERQLGLAPSVAPVARPITFSGALTGVIACAWKGWFGAPWAWLAEWLGGVVKMSAGPGHASAAYVQVVESAPVEDCRQAIWKPGLRPICEPCWRSRSLEGCPHPPCLSVPRCADDTAPEQTMTMHTAQGNDRRATQSLLGLPLPLPPSQPLLALPLPVPSMQPPGSDPAVQAALAAALLQHHQQQAAQQVQQAQLQQLLLNHHQAAAAAAVVAGQQPSAHMHMDMRLQPPQTQAASTPAPALPGAAAQQPSGGTAHPAGGSGSTKRNAGAAAAQSSGSLPGDSAGLQALAAADSLGALSVGDGGSLRSVSVPSKYPPVAEGARKQQEQADPFGIPTDEELASLHDHLTQVGSGWVGGV